MPATRSAAYAMYPQNVVLPEILRALNLAGFEKEDICMVLSPTHPMAAVMRDARFECSGRKESARSARTIAWFTEFGAVVIPAIGFYIRSQAFLRALMTEPDLPSLCGGSKMLAGLGFSVKEAQRLQRSLEDAGVLVYVSCSEGAKAEWALELLGSMGAREVASLEGSLAAGAAAS